MSNEYTFFMINNTSVNKKEITLWQVGGLTFTAVFGTLLHFAYEWTGFKFFAPVSGINESTWEHMKLLFFTTFSPNVSIFNTISCKNSFNAYRLTNKNGVEVSLCTIALINNY